MTPLDRAPRRSPWGAASFAIAILIAGCNVVLGLDGKTVVDEGLGGGGGDDVTAECVLNSECDNDDEVCLFRVCSPPCQEDQDCETGKRCLASDYSFGCVDPDVAVCEEDGDCPEGTVCSSGQCRINCTADIGACLDDQGCNADGVCIGNDTSRDPPPEPPDPGSDCTEEGAFACVGTASAARYICENGEWVIGDACGDGELCDNSSESGACGEVIEECMGRQAGQAFCDGATRKVCGQDLLDVSQALCDSVPHCTLATGAACAKCLPNEFECQGQDLRECNDDLTGFEFVKTCTEQQCSATAGDCSDYACSVDQKRCNAEGVLEICNATRTGFAELEDCGTGLCDFENLTCDECIADAASCATETSRFVCDDEGLGETEVDCETGTCTGSNGSAICSCPEPPADCSGEGNVCRGGGTQVAACGLDDYGCLVTESTASCQGVETCTGSFPNADCTCPTVTQCDAAGEMNGSYCSSGDRVTCTSDAQSCQSAMTTDCAGVAGTELCAGSHPSAVCEKSYGYPNSAATTLTLQNNQLLLTQFTLTESTRVERIGFRGTTAGQVRMAIYDDVSGNPDALRTTTSASSATGSQTEIVATTKVTLGAGTYWIGLTTQMTLTLQRGTAVGPAYFEQFSAWPVNPPLNPAGTTYNDVIPKVYFIGVPQ